MRTFLGIPRLPALVSFDTGQNIHGVAFLLVGVIVSVVNGCSVPNLETPACSEARGIIREFYSIHFGNEMRFSPEGLKLRERFLSPDLIEKAKPAKEGTDPFTTGTDDIPRAFRVGECRQVSAEQVQFDVLLFWRDDERTEQRPVRVDMVDRNDTWLVSDISR